MKKILLLLITLSSLSCYDGLNDMLANLDMKVPICVDANSTAASPDGRGWKNAYKTILDAVDNADAGDEIWVAGDWNIGATITVNESVSIYGGFNGTESRVEQRSTKGTISGDAAPAFDIRAQGIIIDGFNFVKNAGNSIRINSIGTKYSAIVENCDFTNCQACPIFLLDTTTNKLVSIEINRCNFYDKTTPPGTVTTGGAVTVTYGEARISNSTFSRYHSNANGGAIFSTYSSLNIADCDFIYNSAQRGGAISAENCVISTTDCYFQENSATLQSGAIWAQNCSVTATRCDFVQNSCTNSAGAVYISGSAGSLTMNGGSFTGNHASNTGASGGAIFAYNSCIVNLTGVTFTKNSAAANGGAIYSDTATSFIITGCTFGSDGTTASADKNHADTGSGGVLYSTNSTLTLTNDKFYGNTASSGNGGAINILNLSTVTVESCSFGTNDANISVNANSAKSGGAIYSDNSTLTILNDKFYGNKATDGQGGAVYYIANNIHLTVNDCDFTGNTATSSGGALHLQDDGGSSNYNITNTTFDVNTTTGTGGAIHISQGYCNISQSVIKNCISAMTGGGINVEEDTSGKLAITRCALINNSCGSSANGSSIWQNSGELKIYDSLIFRDTAAGLNLIYTDTIYSIDIFNCTFIDKTTSGNIGSFWASNSANAKIYNTVFYGLSINCNGSNFYNTGASSGVISAIEASTDTNTYGITSADFTSFSSNNFLPASTSANLVNKGMNPISDYTFSSVDLTGNPRIAGGIVDIGCYERQ